MQEHEGCFSCKADRQTSLVSPWFEVAQHQAVDPGHEMTLPCTCQAVDPPRKADRQTPEVAPCFEVGHHRAMSPVTDSD